LWRICGARILPSPTSTICSSPTITPITLAQEVKVHGVQLIVLAPQMHAIAQIKTYMKPSHPYVDITLHDNVSLTFDESRSFLRRIGIAGSIIHTPGHSDDSVSLVLDEGAAFTGDLPLPALVDSVVLTAVNQNWNVLRTLKATMIYPGHGLVRPLPPPATERWRWAILITVAMPMTTEIMVQ